MIQPIKTAPRDGTLILAMAEYNGIVVARTAKWVTTEISKYNPDGGYWVCPNLNSVIGEFTHWMSNPQTRELK